MPPQGAIETVEVAFVEGVLLDQAPAGPVGAGLVVPLVVHEGTGFAWQQTGVGAVVIVRRRVAAVRRGRVSRRFPKLLQELRRQRGRVRGLASLCGVGSRFDADGHAGRWCFRLLGWLRRHHPEAVARTAEWREGVRAGAAVCHGVGCLVNAVAFRHQAGQGVTRADRGLGRVVRGCQGFIEGVNGLRKAAEDRFATFGYGLAFAGAKPHAHEQLQNRGYRRRRRKASAAAQRVCLRAAQRLPQPGVGLRQARVQATFFQDAEQVVRQARLVDPAQQFPGALAAELQMGDLVCRHDFEPVEICLPVAESRRYRRQANGRRRGWGGRVCGIDDLNFRAGQRQAVQAEDALHLLQLDWHGPYSTTAPTTSAMLCCSSGSSVRLHTSAAWQARRGVSPSVMRRAA